MELLPAAILGLVQALTEFLPVSSSGHLVLSRLLLGVQTEHGAAFEVAVHFGTTERRHRLSPRGLGLTAKLLDGADEAEPIPRSGRRTRSSNCSSQSRWDVSQRASWGSVKDQLEAAFSSPVIVCSALIATGGVTATLIPAMGEKRGLGSALLLVSPRRSRSFRVSLALGAPSPPRCSSVLSGSTRRVTAFSCLCP